MKSMYLLLALCLLAACAEQHDEAANIVAERRTSVTLAQPTLQDPADAIVNCLRGPREVDAPPKQVARLSALIFPRVPMSQPGSNWHP